MTECSRIGKLFRGCRFEPRYDIYTPTKELKDIISRQWSTTPSDKDKLLEEMIYVQDVCIVCGKVVERCEND